MSKDFEITTVHCLKKAAIKKIRSPKDKTEKMLISIILLDIDSAEFQHDLWLTGNEYVTQEEAFDRACSSLTAYGFQFDKGLGVLDPSDNDTARFFKFPAEGVKVTFNLDRITNRKGETVSVRRIKSVGELATPIASSEIDTLNDQMKNARFRLTGETSSAKAPGRFSEKEQLPF